MKCFISTITTKDYLEQKSIGNEGIKLQQVIDALNALEKDMNENFNKMENKFDKIEKKFDKIEENIDKLESKQHNILSILHEINNNLESSKK